MSLKFLTLFAIITLLCQVIFGIYYSTAIVDQNSLFDANQSALSRLTADNQQLEIRLSSLNSLSHTLLFSDNKTLIPINSTINLN
jgi:hypothetical protein